MGKATPRAIDHEVIDELCDWLEEGKPVSDFCRQPENPSRSTVDAWIDVDTEVAERVARARARGLELLHDEMLRIVDERRESVEVTETYAVENGAERLAERKVKRSNDVADKKLALETRQKYLATCDPARYSEKREIKHTGEFSFEKLIMEADEEFEAEEGGASEDLFT